MLQGKNFAYLNFDDARLLSSWNEDLVMEMLGQVYPNYEYLLLDEVQNLPQWDLWVSAKAFNLSDNAGRLLENQVFVELLRRGYDEGKTLFYYRFRNDKETDFVTRHGNRIEKLIQVCYDLSSERILKREVSSLVECATELKCDDLYIVTMSEERVIEKNGFQIKVVPIYKF